MKNKVSKIVISMLVTSFIMPEIAGARIKGRIRTAASGADRGVATGRSGSIETKAGLGRVTRGPIVNEAENNEITKEIKAAISQLNGKIEEARSVCSGISGDLNTIYGLDAATTAVSAIGTATAGSALAVGLVRNKKQKDLDAESKSDAGLTSGSVLDLSKLNYEDRTSLETYKTRYEDSVKRYDKAKEISYQLYGKITDDNISEEERVKFEQEYNKQEKETHEARLSMRNRELAYNERKKYFFPSSEIKTREMLVEEYELQQKQDRLSDIRKEYSKELARGDRIYKKMFQEGISAEEKERLEKEYEKQEEFADKIRQKILRGESGYNLAKSEYDKKFNIKDETNNSDVMSKDAKMIKNLGHARTGLMAASIATSGTSLGTSAAASVNAGKVAEKMKQCNTVIGEIRILNNKVKALMQDNKEKTGKTGVEYGSFKPETADNIIKNCKGFDITGINAIKNSMTATAVISGIGTGTAIAGTTTSAIANTKKATGTEKGKKLDMASNIMAGITAGTSLSLTAVSGAVIGKVKAAIEVAKSCESAL